MAEIVNVGLEPKVPPEPPYNVITLVRAMGRRVGVNEGAPVVMLIRTEKFVEPKALGTVDCRVSAFQLMGTLVTVRAASSSVPLVVPLATMVPWPTSRHV